MSLQRLSNHVVDEYIFVTVQYQNNQNELNLKSPCVAQTDGFPIPCQLFF